MVTPDTRIHIVLSPWDLTDDYNRHAGTTLLSILDNCSKPAAVHLLHNEKLCIGKEKDTEHNKICYQEIADRYGCSLYYHHVEIPAWTNSIDTVKKLTQGSLGRIYLPELLPDIDKVIYFDCDMIVNTDISTLWNLQLNDSFYAACLDARINKVSSKTKKTYNNAGIDISKYFNSGLMILNLKRLRELERPLSETAVTFYQEYPKLPFFDQDYLNWFCQGEYREINEKYNILAKREDALQYLDDCILHYTGTLKPWKEWHGSIDMPYWDYLMKTPWCKDMHAFYSYISAAPDISRSLSLLENNYFEHISGTKQGKIQYAAHFIFCIIKSFIRGMWNTVSNK